MITFTSITGGKDRLIEEQPKGHYVAFAEGESTTWEMRAPFNRFSCPRRNSRVPKILAHQFISAPYSLWLDGNLQLLKPFDELLYLLDDHDIAFFKHPTRDCLYDEAIECVRHGLDDPHVIAEQVKKYESEGFGKHKGLTENGFILRRHTPKVEAFNNYWWSEYCRHSVRDQISMYYALDKAGLEPKVIDEHYVQTPDGVTRGGIIKYHNHLTNRTATQ